MKTGMSIQELLTEVNRQASVKTDLLVNTETQVTMGLNSEAPNGVEFLIATNPVTTVTISEHCHRQISQRLGIAWKFYFKLLADHGDMVCYNVNELFNREPESRMVRILDGEARAFLSDRYRRLDNSEVLEQVLPPFVKGEIQSTMLSSDVTPDKMYLKILFNDPSLTIDVGEAPRAYQRPSWAEEGPEITNRDLVQPGIVISNSETGQGGLKMQGFFYRAFCLNGCVFGSETAFEFSRNHVGGKLVAGAGLEIFTDSTKKKQDELIIAEMTDGITAMTQPESVNALAAALQAAKQSEQTERPVAAVEMAVKELDLRDTDREGVLESFLRDRDFSQWGMANAVTEQANADDVPYERACELERIGSKILQLTPRAWGQFAHAELAA